VFCEAGRFRDRADRSIEEKSRVLTFGVGRLAVEIGERALERQGAAVCEAHEVLRSLGE
jgi:hypothetical protein